MTSTFTTNLALNLQATGDNPNAWGGVLNANVFTIVDQALGTKLSLSVAGGADVTLTTAQSQNLYFNFTGILTANINVIYPASAGRLIIVNNGTTGSFTLTAKPSGGTGVVIPQGTKILTQIDGTAGVATNAGNIPVNYEITLASATTTDLGTAATNVVAISGTTTITAFGSSALLTNAVYFVRFTGILTLTQNSTSLILPGAANITTAAGDAGIFKYEGSGNWRCLAYQVAANAPGGGFTASSTNTLTNKTFDTAGTGNVFKINSTQISAITGTGSAVLAISPTFTGTPAAPTASASTNTTQIATTAMVQSAIAAVPGIKAWCNFDGTLTGPITINSGFNVTNITKNATGDYTVNFTSNLNNTTYATFITVNGNASGVQYGGVINSAGASSAPTTKTISALRFNTGQTSGGVNVDMKDISVMIITT